MATTDFKTLELTEQFFSQMSNAVEQVVMLNALKEIDEKINNLVEKMDQMELGYKDKIMNKKQACEYLQVSNNTFNKWVLKGLKITTVDQTIRIKKSEIDKFMDSERYLN